MASILCWFVNCDPPPPPPGTDGGPLPAPSPIMPADPQELLGKLEDVVNNQSVNLTSRQLSVVSKFVTAYQQLDQNRPNATLLLSQQVSRSLSKSDRALLNKGFTEKAQLYREAGELDKAELAEKVAQIYTQ